MHDLTRSLIHATAATYKDIVAGRESRIKRGTTLWDQFESVAELCRKDMPGAERQLGEKIHELAVAKLLAEDKTLTRAITYEPTFLADQRRIDFVAERADDNIYIEVKTVHPDTADTEAAWEKYLERRKRHPDHADFVVHQDWMGGKLYGDAFTSRSRFLEYTLAFEDRLAAVKAIKPGPGLLIFCGNGMRWHRSALEDFADFYHAGKHRQDDPFALMEKHHIDHERLTLRRNVDHFGSIKRSVNEAAVTEFAYPIRGPSFGGVAP